MDQKFDMVFNSLTDCGKGYFQIASGYISETAIFFERENIVAKVQAKGQVSFYDGTGNLLASGNAPEAGGGREVYEEISCHVEENKIQLLFPIYVWIDNYPNCDGEYDRWDTKRVGNHTLTLNLQDHTLTVA